MLSMGRERSRVCRSEGLKWSVSQEGKWAICSTLESAYNCVAI